jgi:hypothetical protein
MVGIVGIGMNSSSAFDNGSWGFIIFYVICKFNVILMQFLVYIFIPAARIYSLVFYL